MEYYFLFRWETLTEAEGGKLMVAASKAAQILAQMIGKLQKYGRGTQAARRHLAQDKWERKRGASVQCAVCSGTEENEQLQAIEICFAKPL